MLSALRLLLLLMHKFPPGHWQLQCLTVSPAFNFSISRTLRFSLPPSRCQVTNSCIDPMGIFPPIWHLAIIKCHHGIVWNNLNRVRGMYRLLNHTEQMKSFLFGEGGSNSVLSKCFACTSSWAQSLVSPAKPGKVTWEGDFWCWLHSIKPIERACYVVTCQTIIGAIFYFVLFHLLIHCYLCF